MYHLQNLCIIQNERIASQAKVIIKAGMQQAGGPGGPPQIFADQKAPPGSGGAPHYYRPPRIFDPWCIPEKIVWTALQLVWAFNFAKSLPTTPY